MLPPIVATMDYLHHLQTSSTNDYEYRRVKAFQSISNGTLTNLMLLLDGLDLELKEQMLTSRSDRAIVLRRPSTARDFHIQNPTLLACACAEWYTEIVEFLAAQDYGMDQTVAVRDESNDIVNYSGVSPLCIAAITGKFKMVQILLEHGAELNHQNSIGNTPLFEACFEGHIAIVHYLVQKGASIELANHKKVTCLMIASYANNAEIVKLLTNLGANVNKRDKNERNALFYCLAAGGVAIFKLLRQSGANVEPDAQGMTVLMEASYYGQLDMVKWLLRHKDEIKLDANYFDKKGRNALFYCAEAGNVDVFQYLIANGVSLRAAFDGSTVLMMAALRGRQKLLDYFHQNASQLGLDFATRDKRGRNCLFYCVSGGDIEVFEKLIGYGVKVERTIDGLNLLQQAAVKGELNFGKYLLDHAEDLGLDIQGRDKDGWSALFFAIASGNLQLFKLIYERGVLADPANDGRTLLMQAALRGNLEVLRHLVSNQAIYQSDINARDQFGRSALYLSLQSENYEDVFRNLLERGAKTHKTNFDSNILMETVKTATHLEAIKMLVTMAEKLEFTIHDVDCDGRNVLFYAAQNNCDVMQYLLSLGVTLVNDVNNQTVLMTSSQHGNVELVRLLLARHRELFMDLEHVDNTGRNAMFSTIDGGHLECFKMLSDAGLHCQSDTKGVTVLMRLAAMSHGAFLEYVVSHREELALDLSARDEDGRSAVHYALRAKKYDNLLYLVDNGSALDVNAAGESVVSGCVEEGDFWVVERLATSGVDLSEELNRRDGKGVPCFQRLLSSSIQDALMVALMEMYHDESEDADVEGVTMAMKALRRSEPLPLLRHLVEVTNVNVNVRDQKGRNLLTHALEANNLFVVKYLLSFGARFANDVMDKTPIMTAAEGSHGNVKCLRHLLRYIFRDEESKTETDVTGQSAVHYGVRSGNVDCVAFLLDRGFEIDTSDENGITPFLLAANLKLPAMVELLADRGADVRMRDSQSRSALHLVFDTDGLTLPVTKSLIDRDCDVNARDQSGCTPLMLAAKQDNLRPIRCLLENGADATLVDNDDHDALYHCPEDRHIIRVLISKYIGE